MLYPVSTVLVHSVGSLGDTGRLKSAQTNGLGSLELAGLSLEETRV